MAGTRSLKSNMSPRLNASQIRKVPTVDNAAAFAVNWGTVEHRHADRL